jgi:hypothetical protein
MASISTSTPQTSSGSAPYTPIRGSLTSTVAQAAKFEKTFFDIRVVDRLSVLGFYRAKRSRRGIADH